MRSKEERVRKQMKRDRMNKRERSPAGPAGFSSRPSRLVSRDARSGASKHVGAKGERERETEREIKRERK